MAATKGETMTTDEAVGTNQPRKSRSVGSVRRLSVFERFTDRARKAMCLANQEAQRFNHEYIGTEHILLGLVKEGSGVGANVLRNLGVDLRKVRMEVEKLLKSGPETVTMGKLPQTPRAKKALEYAIEEARNLNHNYVGTEHLLLGLCHETESAAAEVLVSLKAPLDAVREQVINLLGAEKVDLPEGMLDQLRNIAAKHGEVVAPFSFRFKERDKFEFLDADGNVVDSHEFSGPVGAYLFNAMRKHQKSQKLLEDLKVFLDGMSLWVIYSSRSTHSPIDHTDEVNEFRQRIGLVLD